MDRTAIALNRFGLGARAGEPEPRDPRAFLLDQFARFELRPTALGNLPDRATLARELTDYAAQARGAGGKARRNKHADDMSEMSPDPAEPVPSARQSLRKRIRDDYLAMSDARLAAALSTPAPFVERLVHFWANHFAVSADKLQVVGMAGLLEFEAIRPHVLGRFEDMLLAVERHPAMLLYLDQVKSVGPHSSGAERARRRQLGLNENLAREILELHTLGVHGGYSQADVTEFALALTGWTIGGLARGRAERFLDAATEPGAFAFADALHEPGPRTIRGRRYAQAGEAQARAVLVDVAADPATANHLATKLARHFAGDQPPPSLVERLQATYLDSGGDLPAVYRALVDAPEAWAEMPLKFKTPWEWLVSSLRGVGTENPPVAIAARSLGELGQPTWRPGSPAGWDDIAASWAGPDALVRRVEAAERIARRAGDGIDARTLGDRILPGALGDTTRSAIARAESPAQGLALLLVSPEFLRR